MRGRRGARRGLGAVALATAALALLAAGAGGQADSAGRAEWARGALALQYELSSDVGYRDAPWVGTHNSFNSIAEVGGTPSANDSNQQLRIVDQLDLGIRSIELDLHWLLRPGAGAREVVVCHGLGASQGHGGCTTEPTLDRVLDPIVAWLREPAHRDQVLNVHLQDELENAEGYDAATVILREKLGALLYAPSPPAAGDCQGLPLDLSRDDVRAAGAQVVLVSDCGPGAGWAATVFDWGEAHEEGRPLGYRDYPDCDQEVPRSAYDAKMIRYFEDSTRLTEEVSQTGGAEKRDRITPETAAYMARCGVDLIDLDQLVPEDPRFEALVWSWASDHPARGRCAVQRVNKAFEFGRWRSKRCVDKRAIACRRSDGKWIVDGPPTPAHRGRAACSERRAAYAVPRSGYEVQLLRERMERKGVRSVWLGYRKKKGAWTALDQR
jgi:hypothetical protein